MAGHQVHIRPETVRRVTEKLQAFYDDLPEDEQYALTRMLITDDVRGYSMDETGEVFSRPSATVNLNLQDAFGTFLLNIAERTVNIIGEEGVTVEWGEGSAKTVSVERGVER